MRSTARVAAVVVTLCLGAWPSAQPPTAASEPQPPLPPTAEQQPGPRPTFRTEANFVRVDAYPTKDGTPVLGLTAADFEIAEDGVPQRIEQFEHVVVRPAGPQSERVEPGSQREMLQAAEDPRRRVFVLFLDTTHVRFEDSKAIAEPLIRLINRILGPDDLVGVMTPDMSATELVLAQRTLVTEERLRVHWRWGDRFALMNDDREDAYEACYGKDAAGPLIARKRERETLEALQDVVRYLGGVREERKAILTVTNGWELFTPEPGLLHGGRQVPTVDPVGVTRDGQLTTRNPRNRNDSNTLTRMECDADRMRLANIDDEQFLRDLVNEANRSNASFYPIDPRGLVMFETGAGSGVPLHVDQRLRRTHQESMRTLGDGTDGLAVTDTNDLDKGLRRISDDLTSYYLLGYYSTNTRTDGGFRSLKVRVTRPGVAVRARRGYRAASPEEVARSRSGSAAPAVGIVSAVQTALDMLAAIRPDARLRLRATSSPGSELMWIAGELSPDRARTNDWAQGGTVDLQITRGTASASSRVIVKPGERAFLTAVTLPGADAEFEVQARISSPDGEPASAALRVAATPQPLFYRRGPTTANRQVATADVRFTRADRAHLELPAGADVKPAGGRLLDRTGQPTAIPVTVGERIDEPTGQRWITADVILASLAPGDYLVEVGMAAATGESRVLAAIRIVR